MIRHATIDDIPTLLPLMREFAVSLGDFYGDSFCSRSTSHLLRHCIDSGVLVLYCDIEPIGLIAGVVSRCLWNAQITQLDEIAYYVSSNYRQSSAGARLLRAWSEEVDRLKPDVSSMKLMSNSPDISKHYNRLGYQKLETTYIRRA